MLLDEKRHVIMPLLEELRKHNLSIGTYEKSMITESFDYSVKLSNGLIKLPGELIDDYEKSPGAITLDRIKFAAATFTLTNSTPISPIDALPDHKFVKAKRPNILIASIAIIVILIVVIAVFLVNRAQQRDKDRIRIEHEQLDSMNTAQINQQRLDSANTARLKQEKLDSANTAVELTKTSVRDRIRFYVTATCTYKFKVIGNISNLKITVTNNTDYTMDAVKVRAAYMKQAGGVYKYEEINFVGILPHTQATLDAPDSDRGTHVQVGVETISSSQLGLSPVQLRE